MILQPFFRRHFWLTAVVFVLILGTSSSLSRYLHDNERADFFQTQGNAIYTYIAAHPGDKIDFVRNLNETEDKTGVPFTMDILRDGKSLVTGESVSVEHKKNAAFFEHSLEDPPGSTLTVRIVKGKGPIHHGLASTFAVMVLAIVLASALSIFLLFWSFRDRAELAKSVLMRMQQGDLKARFPVTFMDEAGQIMILFNEMANEIERLVEQLRQNESYRLHLMQELTHDLRTPVSSLRNLIESLRFSGDKLQPKAREEFMDLAYQETEYLTRLVEDLLFLALVLEPKYKRDADHVVLKELVSAQLSATASHHAKIKFELHDELEPGAALTGSEHQIKRLMRNALENSFSFAKSSVNVRLFNEGADVLIEVQDDGPGLSAEALANYGKKRSTRYQEPTQEGRISVGLGSVIIQVIAQAHGGNVAIANRAGTNGANLRIALKAE